MKSPFLAKKNLFVFLLSLSTVLFGQNANSTGGTGFFSNNQDSIIAEAISKNTSLMAHEGNRFSGKGWELLLGEIQTSNHVLIGEDHFFNEIPEFVERITDEVRFDNFICEVDPFSIEILKEKIENFSEERLKAFKSDFGNTLSFFALYPEFQLLEKLIKKNTNIIGVDQIVMTTDRFLASELKKITTNGMARNIYAEIEENSAKFYPEFVSGNGSPFFFSDSFNEKLEVLGEMDLSKKETSIIESLKLSKKIYDNQSHSLRIQLIKHNYLDAFQQIKGHKNLYKLGVIHTGKGESLLGGFDIGNVAHNIADSEFENSLHILVLGKSGIKGSPMKGMPNTPLDISKGPLTSLRPFFDVVKGSEDWYVFDVGNISKDLNQSKA